ncbi:hypothetical protein [Streptomyces violaceusniger]|uniref:hypothetical protein n=1 Tax=Streptomyces violaceusniger TaxID=68280 RepID=UPI0036A81271
MPGTARPPVAHHLPAVGPRMRVEAEGAPGAGLPAALPGAVVHEYGPAAAHGSAAAGPAGRVVWLTAEVGAADSDALLRTLLAADPPWHIRAVTAIGDTQEPAEGPQEPAQAPQEPAEAPQEPAEASREPAEARHEHTEAPHERTEGPQEPNKAPQESTEALYGPAEAPKEKA